MIDLIAKEASVTELAKDMDVDAILADMQANTREVDATDFIRAMIRIFGYTFEYARSLVYGLIELGRAVLTDRYTLRLS